MRLLKKRKKEYTKVYDSINNLPIRNWVAIKESLDLKHLCLDSANEDKIPPQNELLTVWRDINLELTEMFGMKKSDIARAKMKRAFMLNYIDAVLQKDHIKKLQLKNVKEDYLGGKVQENINFMELVIGVGKSFGYSIDSSKMTVREFYHHIEYLNKQNG